MVSRASDAETDWDPARVVHDPAILRDVVTAAISRAGASGWTIRSGDEWCRATPPQASLPDQGWKIHVSATPLSAPIVLARAAQVLVRDRAVFKFSCDMRALRRVLATSVNRGSGGKFITVYPRDDAQFRRLAERLHVVTAGLPGPVVLSDRPYAPGSLVHYRFGGFTRTVELTNDGALVPVLTAPDGHRVADERKPWFAPPGWAQFPFPEPEPEPESESESESDEPASASAGRVILGGRFVVSEAIRHSYRGGVFRAVDQETGADVVVKQARPHVAAALDGSDARDRLRHEAEMLDRLAPLGLAPRRIALFTQQDNVFLAEELVPGTSLAGWTAERIVGAWQGRGAPVTEAAALALRLVRIVAEVHAQDLVLRDLTPNNVMIGPDGRVRLIDWEHAVPHGSRVWKAFTEGYTAPEVAAALPFGPAPALAADLFGLGATILHLACGRGPWLMHDQPENRPVHGRIALLTRQLGRHMPAVRQLAPLVLGLTRNEPEQRWSLDRAESFLADVLAGIPATLREETSAAEESPRFGAIADRLLADGFAHVVREMTADSSTLWRADEYGRDTHPCNVQHGAAGVLGVLAGAAGTLGAAELRDAVASAARWIDCRLPKTPRMLPGLYYGFSGTAWSLFDAARLLGDESMAERAVALARRLPATWPNPDVCHGAAGAGLALLHLWRATGDPELESAVLAAADGILGAAEERDGGLLWRVPADFDSTFAGSAYYGFAHGVAGIGCFLLYAAVATGRPDYLDAARRAGVTLEATARTEGEAAWWPAREGDSGSFPLVHWCSGSAGVGTFLIRLWSVTGDPRFRAHAEAAGAAVLRDRWYSSTGTCHGLSGDGEFLLDLAGFTGDEKYRTWARELAMTMYPQHVMRDGRMLLPDESGRDLTAGYAAGLSGTLGFLLRLRRGVSRWWMPDEILRGPRAGTTPRPLTHLAARHRPCPGQPAGAIGTSKGEEVR